MYRPVTPLLAFIEKNSFKGKNIVLFSTFNGGFKDEAINEVKQQLEKKGGKFIDHIYVKCRRAFVKLLSKEEIVKSTQKLLDTKESEWSSVSKK